MNAIRPLGSLSQIHLPHGAASDAVHLLASTSAISDIWPRTERRSIEHHIDLPFGIALRRHHTGRTGFGDECTGCSQDRIMASQFSKKVATSLLMQCGHNTAYASTTFIVVNRPLDPFSPDFHLWLLVDPSWVLSARRIQHWPRTPPK